MRLRTDLLTYQIGQGFDDRFNPPGDHKARRVEHPMCRCTPLIRLKEGKKTKMKKLLFGATAETVVPHMPRPKGLPSPGHRGYPDFITLRPFSSHSETKPGDVLEVVCKDGRGEVIGRATVQKIMRAPLSELVSHYAKMEPEVRALGYPSSLTSESLRMEHRRILCKYYPSAMVQQDSDWVALFCEFEPIETEVERLQKEFNALFSSLRQAHVDYIADVVLPQIGLQPLRFGNPPVDWFPIRSLEQARSAIAAVRRYKRSLGPL